MSGVSSVFGSPEKKILPKRFRGSVMRFLFHWIRCWEHDAEGTDILRGMEAFFKDPQVILWREISSSDGARGPGKVRHYWEQRLRRLGQEPPPACMVELRAAETQMDLRQHTQAPSKVTKVPLRVAKYLPGKVELSELIYFSINLQATSVGSTGGWNPPHPGVFSMALRCVR